jgi:NodT family efflux transporter outer membrane factor (OMF) lipoprotein
LTLRAAGTRIVQARAVRSIAVGSLFPQTQQATDDYTRNQLSQNVANPFNVAHYDQWDLGGNLSWELDFWGRFRRGIESADAALEASVANYDNVLVMLLSDVATSYVNMRTYQERLRLVRDNVQSQEKTLALATKRFNAKVITKLDMLQCRDNVAVSKALVQTLDIGLRQQNNALCILLGIPPCDLTGDPRVGDGAIPCVPSQVCAGVPCDLLRRRPDVRQAERLAAAQSAQIGIAESELYPHFAINGVFQWQAENVNRLFEPTSVAGSIGPTFTWSILNYGRLCNGIVNQRAKFQELVLTYQNTVLKAGSEVENGIVGFLKWQDEEVNLKDAVASLAEAERLCLLEAQQGGKDYNRLYIIQLEKTRQEDQWATSQEEIVLNLIDIYRALGGGWQLRLACPGGKESTAVADAPLPEAVLPEEIPAPLPNDRGSTRSRP